MKSMIKQLSKSHGFSLIEVLMVTAILGVMALVMVTMTTNQLKTNNFLEFQLKRDQLRASVVGQFLTNPQNCACLFKNAGVQSFSSSGTALITTATPITGIGRFNFPTAGSCAGSNIPSPLVTTAGVDSMKMTALEIVDVQNPIANVYQGNLRISVESMKDVMGPKVVAPVLIPVVINTTPTGSGQNFDSCSMSGGAGGGTKPSCRVVVESWDNDNCTGRYRYRKSDWSDDPGSPLKWSYINEFGAPVSSYQGKNSTPGDIACLRIGIECR